MEMVNKLPGFTFDGGAGVRGFEGAAGNVLIDGERPATKSDDLESILRRIPAGQVDHIDVIRGGAPGIDMQGKTVLANVVRRKGDSVTGLRRGGQHLRLRRPPEPRAAHGGNPHRRADASWKARS